MLWMRIAHLLGPSRNDRLPFLAEEAGAVRSVWDVRYGSLADIGAGETNVRFTPEGGH